MMKNTLFLLALLLLANPCKSDVTLPAIFTSNMVLKRDMPLIIWGWADKNEKISIQLIDKFNPRGQRRMVPGEFNSIQYPLLVNQYPWK